MLGFVHPCPFARTGWRFALFRVLAQVTSYPLLLFCYCFFFEFLNHFHKGGHLPSLFDNLFQYASCRHTHNTRYASKQNFCKPRPRTNTGKQMFSYQAIDFWRDIPYYLKDLRAFSFPKEIKHCLILLSEQYSKKFV